MKENNRKISQHEICVGSLHHSNFCFGIIQLFFVLKLSQFGVDKISQMFENIKKPTSDSDSTPKNYYLVVQKSNFKN